MPILPDDRTEIAPEGGLRIIPPKSTTIDSETLIPANSSRFILTQSLAAKIEAIARARLKYARITEPSSSLSTQTRWSQHDNLSALAQSVIASSEIEGEEISVDLIPVILNDEGIGDSNIKPTDELSQRLTVVRNIYKAYLWALTSSRVDNEYVSKEFICELHNRMFCDSSHYSAFAGKLKDRDVEVRGSVYLVKTLSYTKTSEALQKLCDRTNLAFRRNRSHQESPLITIIGEFLLDFLAIHPFLDGNGRIARLLSTYLLDRVGYHFSSIYPMDTIINESRAEYFEALFLGQRNWYTKHEDLTTWIEFYVDAVYEQWERAHRKLKRAESTQRPMQEVPNE